ncbi:hypothetical protein C8J57DRAFT_1608851 [Mycena rebaudengoi]|nr:hypothetical protein C8J57DRAFT_1608851 [Mycena rebaudengoi]
MLNESPARLRGSSAISRVKAAATFISTPGEGAEQEHKSHIGHEFKMLSECDRLNAALAMRTVGLTGVPSRICFLRASHFRTPQTRGVQSIPVVRCKRTERPEYGLHVQSQSAKQTYDIRFINTQNFQQFKISALSYTGCLASFLKKNLSLVAKAAFSVQEGRSGFHVLSPTFLKRYHVESDDDELEGIDPELRLCTVRIVHSAIAESTVANIRKTRAATANRGSGGASEKRQQESWQGVRNVYMRIMERSLFRTPVIEMSTSSVIFPPPLASWDATILTFLRSDNDSSEFYCPVKTPGRDLGVPRPQMRRKRTYGTHPVWLTTSGSPPRVSTVALDPWCNKTTPYSYSARISFGTPHLFDRRAFDVFRTEREEYGLHVQSKGAKKSPAMSDP